MTQIIFYLILAMTKFISLLPSSIFKNPKSWLWRILQGNMSKRKSIIAANINHCFERKTIEWRSELIEKIWAETFFALYANNLAWNASKDQIRNLHIDFINEEVLKNAINKKKGVLLLFRHSLYLELSARLLSTRYEVHGLERPNNSLLIQKLQSHGRLKSVKTLISNANIKQCIKILKSGDMILYGPDQDYRNKRSVVSSFFGKDCLTTTVPFTLKKLTDCEIIYFDFFRTDSGYKAIFDEFNQAYTDPKDLADQINLKIENSVMLAPEQYLWHHRRFKSQSPEIYGRNF